MPDAWIAYIHNLPSGSSDGRMAYIISHCRTDSLHHLPSGSAGQQVMLTIRPALLPDGKLCRLSVRQLYRTDSLHNLPSGYYCIYGYSIYARKSYYTLTERARHADGRHLDSEKTCPYGGGGGLYPPSRFNSVRKEV